MTNEFTLVLIERSTQKKVKEIAKANKLKIYALLAEMLKLYEEKEAQNVK